MKPEDVTDPKSLAQFCAEETAKTPSAAVKLMEDKPGMGMMSVLQEVNISTSQHGGTTDALEKMVRELRAKYDAVIGHNAGMLDGVRKYRMAVVSEVGQIDAALARLDRRIKQVDELAASLAKLSYAMKDPNIQRVLGQVAHE